jgi:hypothetical protein
MRQRRQKPARSGYSPKKRPLAGLFLILFSLLLPQAAPAQEYAANAISRHILTNEGVVALAKAGFDEYFIVERIRTSRTKLDATVQGLISLKDAGLSEDLIREVALQDRRNYLAERWSYTAPPESPNSSLTNPLSNPSGNPAASTTPAAPAGSSKVMVEKHWWGFHWVRVSP